MGQHVSFDALFTRRVNCQPADLKLKERVLIELQNPLLPAWGLPSRKELWFDPADLR